MSQEHQAHLEDSGAAAQNSSAAAGERAVIAQGPVHSSIITGDHSSVKDKP